jgi:hypothetical protein
VRRSSSSGRRAHRLVGVCANGIAAAQRAAQLRHGRGERGEVEVDGRHGSVLTMVQESVSVAT